MRRGFIIDRANPSKGNNHIKPNPEDIELQGLVKSSLTRNRTWI
ncbi:hypothetical protein [Gramella jeungdoensis]|nr:hypothetical protein [Gramella jeungdoensis]